MGEYWDKIRHLNDELTSGEMRDLLLLIAGKKGMASNQFKSLNNGSASAFLSELGLKSRFEEGMAYLWRTDRARDYGDFCLRDTHSMDELLTLAFSKQDECEAVLAQFNERKTTFYKLQDIPVCCYEAFSPMKCPSQKYFEQLRNLHQKSGDEVLYSQVGLFYIPCSLECRATKDLNLSDWLKAEAPELWNREFEWLKREIYDPTNKPLGAGEMMIVIAPELLPGSAISN